MRQKHILLDFLIGVRDAEGEVGLYGLRVPGLGGGEEVGKRFFDGEIAGMSRIGLDVLTEGDEVAVGRILTGNVVGSPGCVAPDGIAAYG